MDNKELTKVALKVFSIYIMVQAILVIPSFFQAYVMLSNGSYYSSSNWFSAIGIASVVLLGILSLFIWKLSVTTVTQTQTPNNNSTSGLSEAFLLSLLGLYLMFNGLSKFAIASVGTYYSAQASTDINYDITQNIIYLAVNFTQIIIGLTLVIKTNGWLALLNKLRVAGTH